ncbi:hypothetical protein RSOLAG1IB_05341 [Rhizoctonia solani AG-1 IB]|uniref:Uncharacterized protein n=1 Tax=Thanatephorus cucumeris (strain AG1-IB / isolate 7/3/14) TaxID=1108050 RepID=A0A0B7G466_THACB|nr:hypothetical protein RSOLAG1IB_05341 [Rhizoctonia solani AG-1 IB]
MNPRPFGSRANVTFYEIPWPVPYQANSFEDLTSDNIATFLLSPHHSQDKSPRARLQVARYMWHPNEFAQKVLPCVAESHRKAVFAAVRVVWHIVEKLSSTFPTKNDALISNLLIQETNWIIENMAGGRLEGHLTPEEFQWLEVYIQMRNAEEERRRLERMQEEEAQRLRKLEENRATKLRAAQAEEFARAIRQECFTPSITYPAETLPLRSASSASTAPRKDLPHQNGQRRFNSNASSANQLHPERPRRTSSALGGSTAWRARAASTEGPPLSAASDPARFAGTSYSKLDSSYRGADIEPQRRRHNQRSSSFSYSYLPADAIAAVHRAEDLRRYREYQDMAKRREQQAAAARKALEEERQRIERERRNQTEERWKAEEYVGVAWRRYEYEWQGLLSGALANGRRLTFYDIPWPVLVPARSIKELRSGDIKKFLLSPYHSGSKTRKMRLHEASAKWHPDKFAELFRGRVDDSLWPTILAAINLVSYEIQSLIDEMDE